jgi:hypothetical protein
VSFFSDHGNAVRSNDMIKDHARLAMKEDAYQHFAKFARVNLVSPSGDFTEAFANANRWGTSVAKTEAVDRIRSWMGLDRYPFSDGLLSEHVTRVCKWRVHCRRYGNWPQNPNRMLTHMLNEFIVGSIEGKPPEHE